MYIILHRYVYSIPFSKCDAKDKNETKQKFANPINEMVVVFYEKKSK